MRHNACVPIEHTNIGKGGAVMATSSIFENLEITDPKKVEEFADALEAASFGPKGKHSTSGIPLVTDIEEIRKFMTVGGNG